MGITNFWDSLKQHSEDLAVIDTGANTQYTFGEIDSAALNLASNLKLPEKGLIFLFTQNNYESTVAYLAALKSGNAVCLFDDKLNREFRLNLINIYNPEFIITSSKTKIKNFKLQSVFLSLAVYKCTSLTLKNISPDLALLLSTSGTTGSPKLVRLSYVNIQSNAEAIAEYLRIDRSERPISSLPLSYSYGLSVLNSHLLKGASILLTDKTFVIRDFWKTFNDYLCTSFAGVPYTYQLLKKTNFHKINLPSLKYLTQAGGALDRDTFEYFLDYAEQKNILFYTMYGQTEASPRISFVPPENCREKIGSIGISIPGGSISLFKDKELVSQPFINGEIIYSGKNVMLGYAANRNDLEKGDEMNGVLTTGDIGYRDNDGYYFLTGRIKRFIKVFGSRLNLDDAEKLLETRFKKTVACVGEENKLIIFIEGGDNAINEKDIKNYLVRMYRIYPWTISVNYLKEINFTSTGKKDYSKLNF